MEGRNCEAPTTVPLGLSPCSAGIDKDGDMTLGTVGDMTRDVPPGLLMSELMLWFCVCGWIGREDDGKTDGAGETDETGEIEWVVVMDESTEYEGAEFGAAEKSVTGAKGDEKL